MAVSKEGESPSPSSLSSDMLQIDPRSPRPVPPELEELDDAELHPELPAEKADEKPKLDSVWEGRVSNQELEEKSPPNPLLQREAMISWLSSMIPDVVLDPMSPGSAPAPVLRAMCASMSRRAASTCSGSPVTSNTGSLSRDGVTM